MPNENIGGISVSITIDQTDFKVQLDQAISLAKDSSAKIGQALSSGAGQSDQFTASVDRLIKSLGDAGTALQSVTSQAGHLGNASGQAAGGVDDLIGAFARGAGVNLTLGAMVAGVLELGKASIEAFADLDRATLSLTALTGSAETAERELSNLRNLAQDEALSLPELIQANQRLTALGVSALQIPGILRAAADGAAAMNTSLIVATNALDRMAASGSVAGRNLTQLGLTTNDLARVMGVAVSQVGLAFKALDESDRIEVLSQALDKFAGVAEARADSLVGSFQRLENTATTALQSIGRELAPATKEVLDFADKSIKAFSLVEIALTNWKGVTHESAQDTKDFAAQTELISQKLTAIGVIIPRGTMSMHEWHDALMDAVKAYNSHNDAATPTAKALQEITDKQLAANVEVSKAKAVLDLAAQGLNGTTEQAQIYQRAVAAYDEAQKKATISTKQLTDSLGEDMQAAQKLVDNVSRAQDAFDRLTNVENRTEQQNVALGIAARNLETAQKALQAATDGLTTAQENHLSKLRNYGPAYDGINRLLSEVSGNFRVTQQAVVDLSTGETTYVDVVKTLTATQEQAYTKLQALLSLRAQYISQGVNTKTVDQDVAKAEKALTEAFEQADLRAITHTATIKGIGDAYAKITPAILTLGGGLSKVFTQFDTDAATGEKAAKEFKGVIDDGSGSLDALKGKLVDSGTSMEDLTGKSGSLVTVLRGLSDTDAQLFNTFSNSAAILERNAKAIQANVEAASHGIVSNQALQAAYEKTNADVSQGVRAMGELSAAAEKVARSYGDMSAAEAKIADGAAGVTHGIDAETNTFNNLDGTMRGLTDTFAGLNIQAQDWLAYAIAFSKSPMATSTPQDPFDTLGTSYGKIKQLELTQIAYPNAYIDQYGNIVIPELQSKTANSNNAITHGPMAQKPTSSTGRTSGSTSGTTGGGTSTSGGVDAITQALLDAQNAYSQATSGESAALPNVAEIQKLSDALQLATNNYLNAGHAISDLGTITADATTGLTTLSTAINGIGTAASSMGSAVTQSATITQAAVNASAAAVQAQSAIVSKVQAFLDTPVGTAITSPASSTTSSTLAYAAIGAPKVGTNWTPTVIINNPVVTSQSQADQMASQLVNTLRNVVGLKL